MRTFCFLLLLIPLVMSAQEPPLSEKNFRIYSTKIAREVSLQDIAADMQNYDVLFFGEEHNDSVTHYAQHELLKELHAQFGSNLALSMEMFDRDVQLVMNEYLSGFIREKNFLKDARAWSNYRDYRPLVEFAKEQKLGIICTNAPTRYTNLAGRKGQQELLKLPPDAQRFFAPLPYDTASGGYYEKLMAMMQPPLGDTSKAHMPAMAMHGFNLIMAQSLWDATMAYSIAEYDRLHPKKKILHINGKFHSDEHFAIVTQLKKYAPLLKSLVISSADDAAFPQIDWSKYAKFGDYIIITDPKIPKTFKSE
ncbi:MAG: ChaN family lipoprotein [Bacteroidota bacterium]